MFAWLHQGKLISGTSKETELKLLNVARASLEELLEVYRDYLRTRGHALWEELEPAVVREEAGPERLLRVLESLLRENPRRSSYAMRR